MKNAIRIISLILVLLFVLTSCSDKNSETGTEADTETEAVIEYRSFDNIGEYTIVRSEDADDETKKASMTLFNALKEKFGVKLDVNSDFVKNGEV